MKLVRFLMVIVLAAMLLTACAPALQGFVELPDGVKADITALVLVVVSLAATWLATKIPWLGPILKPYVEPLAMLLASALINFIQTATPDAFGGIVILVVQLILAIIGLFTLVKELRKNKARGFRW